MPVMFFTDMDELRREVAKITAWKTELLPLSKELIVHIMATRLEPLFQSLMKVLDNQKPNDVCCNSQEVILFPCKCVVCFDCAQLDKCKYCNTAIKYKKRLLTID